MGKWILLTILFVLFTISETKGQNSIFGGYGMQGPNFRLTLDLDKELLPNFKTYFYGELGLDGYKFDNQNFSFRSTNYPSKTRLTFVELGLEGTLEHKSLFLTPYLGIRYIYARFVDKALFQAIGDNNLVRYWDGVKVGPEVENAYGNNITFDLGTRLGIKFTEKLSLVISAGISPIEFSTTTTLFGKYWGEAPYNNSYYIDFPIFRVDGGLNYNF